MNLSELLAGAKKDYSVALNLGALIVSDSWEVNVSELLESFVIIHSWIERLEKEEPDEKARIVLTEMFQKCVSQFETIFEDMEVEVSFYLRVDVHGLLPEYLETAKEFVKRIQVLPNVSEKLKTVSFD